MSRRLLEQLVPQHWKTGGDGAQRVRFLQSVDDLVNRPVANRSNGSTSATAINLLGVNQSSGIGTQGLQPKRYAEFTVKARVTYNVSAIGQAYIYAYRTFGPIPANGIGPNAGDVIVGGDAFTGGPVTPGVNVSASFSYIDTGLDVTKTYYYYLAVLGPLGGVLKFISNSQIFVMERS